MRIISGIYKGRKIPGKVPPNVRPTLDALRETIFNIIANYTGFDGKVVCDLCCGTGAMGLEALSRGAEFVYFVDTFKSALAFVQNVCKTLKVPQNNYKIVLHRAENFLLTDKIEKKIDLVFADPPYSANIVNKIISSFASSGKVPANAFLSCEFGLSNALILPDSVVLLSERTYSISKFALLQKITN